ncbi:MAG: Lrp/AsnC family leucine-responsive transcriptional regulator [Candidatus Azotimanducaceae bacterium]|jgi:Lrp/AsnC family leucine-responsive transcriptional regulator
MTRLKLDKAEKEILRLLQENARISNVELADKVGLSESPCFRRTKHLEDSGIIKTYTAVLDQRQLGLQVTAFVQVSLNKQNEADTTGFLEKVASEDHITECHAMSGSYDYLLKVVTQSMDHFSDLSMQKILKYPGVQDIESHFSLKENKLSRVLPIS